MIKFTKAHAYGNDFIYVRKDAAEGAHPGGPGGPGGLVALARELCDRHTGIGGDGLIVFEPTPDGASMLLFNADGSRAEVSGNGVRALGAILLRNGQTSDRDTVTIHTEAGSKRLTRNGAARGGRGTRDVPLGDGAAARSSANRDHGRRRDAADCRDGFRESAGRSARAAAGSRALCAPRQLARAPSDVSRRDEHRIRAGREPARSSGF